MGVQVDKYLILETIGHGTYGTVHKARDTETGNFVAIKVVNNSKLSNPKLMEYLDQEIQILLDIKHPNIVALYQAIKRKDKTYLVMEYCKGGDFDHFLKKKKRLSEDEARYYLQQLTNALRFMRDKMLIHRDLKPGNILLSVKDDEDKPILKLADFGYARYIEPQAMAETHLGTPLYMAPEVFAPPHHYDSKADLWSVGCIFYEMLIGRVPYIAQSQMALFQLIESQPVSFPPEIPLSDTCKDLILKLLNKNRTFRITFEEFFAHPFLNPAPAVNLSSPQYDLELEDESQSASQIALQGMVGLHLGGSPEKPIVGSEGAVPSFLTNFATSSPGKADTVSFGGSSSLNRPKTNPYKAISADSEEGYIVVNPAEVEVNAIADVLKKAPTASSSDSHQVSIVSRTGRANSPTMTTGFQAGSPPSPFPSASPSSSPSRLSQVLATTKMVLPSFKSPTEEEQTARAILSSLSNSASSDDERDSYSRISESARKAIAVAELAMAKWESSKAQEIPEDEGLYHAYILYLKALSVITVAMNNARKYWQNKGQTIVPAVKDVVMLLRDKFNEYLENAAQLNKKVKETKYRDSLTQNQIVLDQFRVIFDAAREMGKKAGFHETGKNIASSERQYSNAYLLFQVLLSLDLPEAELLNDTDRSIVEKFAISVQARMQLQKKLPSSSSSD